MSEKLKYTKAFTFILIFLFLLSSLSFVFAPSSICADMDKLEIVMMEFNQEREQSIDVLILGDSEAYRSLSPLEMYRDYGFTSYVCATPAQYISDSYDILNKALERQKPHICILDTNLLFREKRNAISVVSVVEGLFPIFKYHNAWKNLFKSADEKVAVASSFKGYRYSDKIDPAFNESYSPEPDDALIVKANKKYLERIAKACADADIELLLLSTPSKINWSMDKHNSIIALADELSINFLDLNLVDEINIDWSADTMDKGDHLNFNGAQKVSAFLGTFLNDNFTLCDHRNEPKYSEWNAALKQYSRSTL